MACIRIIPIHSIHIQYTIWNLESKWINNIIESKVRNWMTGLLGSPGLDPLLPRRTPPPPYYHKATSAASLLNRLPITIVPSPGLHNTESDPLSTSRDPLSSPSSGTGAICSSGTTSPIHTSAPPSTVTLPTPSTRYNRRNNPELEKRRIHHCDYPGILYFINRFHIKYSTGMIYAIVLYVRPSVCRHVFTVTQERLNVEWWNLAHIILEVKSNIEFEDGSRKWPLTRSNWRFSYCIFRVHVILHGVHVCTRTHSCGILYCYCLLYTICDMCYSSLF